MIYYGFAFILESMIVYIIIRFELTEFEMRTVVRLDGKIEIQGVGINENVLFNFTLNHAPINSLAIVS